MTYSAAPIGCDFQDTTGHHPCCISSSLQPHFYREEILMFLDAVAGMRGQGGSGRNPLHVTSHKPHHPHSMKSKHNRGTKRRRSRVGSSDTDSTTLLTSPLRTTLLISLLRISVVWWQGLAPLQMQLVHWMHHCWYNRVSLLSLDHLVWRVLSHKCLMYARN